MEPAEIDRLIDTIQYSKLSQQLSLELFFGMFEDPTDAELCMECVEAVLGMEPARSAEEE